MARRKYSFFHSSLQKMASTRPGAWFYSHTLHRFDRIFLRLTGGRATMSNLLAGLPVVMVTTTGAKSGLARTLPLMCIRDERDARKFAIIASNWGQRHYPAWYFNLKANPRASCSIRGQVAEYVAHEADGEEYEMFWQYATDTYIGYPLYKERVSRRRIPIMVMEPVPE